MAEKQQLKREIAALDGAVAEAATPADHDDARHPLLSLLSEAGDQPPAFAFAGGLALAGLLREDRRMRRCGARMLVGLAIATIAKSRLKTAIDRERPNEVADESAGSEPRCAFVDTGDAKRSMPSGHSANAAVMARALSRDYPRLAVPGTLLATGMAVVQLPRKSHFLTDLLAGATVGLLSESLAARLLGDRRFRKSVRR